MEQVQKAIDAEIDKKQRFYPNKEALLLPVLHAAQRAHGWLPHEVMELIAESLDLPLPKVKQVASFYTMFYKKPVGKCHLQVCNNIACYLRGSADVIHYIENKLGILPGETTKDGLFTLTEVECLGSCGTAPVVQVNDDYHESLTKADLDKILEAR